MHTQSLSKSVEESAASDIFASVFTHVRCLVDERAAAQRTLASPSPPPPSAGGEGSLSRGHNSINGGERALASPPARALPSPSPSPLSGTQVSAVCVSEVHASSGAVVGQATPPFHSPPLVHREGLMGAALDAVSMVSEEVWCLTAAMVRLYICMCMYIHVCVCVCVYIYIYIYVHRRLTPGVD